MEISSLLGFGRKLPRAPKAISSQSERPQAPKPAVNMAKPPVPKAAASPSAAPRDVQVTGSVGRTPQTPGPRGEKPASVSQVQLAEVTAGPAKAEGEPGEWAEVSLAAKVHNAPSVSSPTVRLYRVGTRLKVIGREHGWIKVV